MTRVRKMMLEELQLRNYAQDTIRHCPRAVEDFDIQMISPQAGRVAPSTHLSGNPALSQCLSERIPQRTAGDDLRITFRKILYFWNPSFLSPISNFGTISRITLVWQVLWQS